MGYDICEVSNEECIVVGRNLEKESPMKKAQIWGLIIEWRRVFFVYSSFNNQNVKILFMINKIKPNFISGS